MERPASGEKVLRACVVQGGKVIEEQRLGKRERLSIGNDIHNTFIVSDPELPGTHVLFDVKGSSYELLLTDTMRGRISTDTDPNPVDIAALRQQGTLKKKGGHYALPLTFGHRGKVVIGETTVIFQFVPPPPEVKQTVQVETIHVPLKQRIDWTLLLCFAGILALELPLVVAFYFQPKPKEVSLETMDQRWAELIVPDKKPVEKKPEEKKTDGKKQEQAKKDTPKEEPQDDAAKAKAKAARSQEIRKSIASKGVLALFGTTGEGKGAVADVLGDGGLSNDLDSAFEGISGVGLATTGNERTTRGAGSGEAASIGGLATSGGGAVGLGNKKEARVGSVRTEAPEVDGALDSEAIARVVRSRMRMVQDCYERELKRDSSLQGKIEIEFTIGEDGAVEEARVSNNKMGSNEVASCIVGRIQRWKFPKPDGGSVTVNFPFIFTPSG